MVIGGANGHDRAGIRLELTCSYAIAIETGAVMTCRIGDFGKGW
jgi:hypothetical protein